MPTGIYDRSISAGLKRLFKMKEDIEARIKLEQQADTNRQKLLAYCKKEGYTRGDVGWVYDQLPLQRISKYHRLKRIAESQEVTPRRKRTKPAHPVKSELIPWGQQLRKIRTKGQMRAAEVGKAIGYHESMVTAWERGAFRLKEEQYKKLTDALGPLPEYPVEFKQNKQGENMRKHKNGGK